MQVIKAVNVVYSFMNLMNIGKECMGLHLELMLDIFRESQIYKLGPVARSFAELKIYQHYFYINNFCI